MIIVLTATTDDGTVLVEEVIDLVETPDADRAEEAGPYGYSVAQDAVLALQKSGGGDNTMSKTSTDDHTAETASRLRIIRRARGLTQSALGERCGMEQAHVARAEQGRHEHTLSTLRTLAGGLGVDVAILVQRHWDAWLYAAEIVSEMSAEDVARIHVEESADHWAEGIGQWDWDDDQGERPSAADTLAAMVEIATGRPEPLCASCSSHHATLVRDGSVVCDGCAHAIDAHGCGVSDAYAVECECDPAWVY